MSGQGGAANSRAKNDNDINAWMRARNDHVRNLRQNAMRSGRRAPDAFSPADRLEASRRAAGDLANAAGLAVGAVRGAAHIAEGTFESLSVMKNILDPFYAPLHPNTPAVLPLIDAAQATLRAGEQVARHPAETFHRANVALNPAASPAAPTVAGEAWHRFGIGKNQGELAVNIVGAFEAPEVLATRAWPVEQQVARWMARGLTRRQARYMAEPYKGMGHHYYPRAAKLPEHFRGIPLPKFLAKRPMPLPRVLSDSPFNVLKPKGISRGDMYEKHFAVDPSYGGGSFPAHVGGGTWSGTKLGLKVHGPLGRVVHGAPPALKQAISGAAGGILGAVATAQRQQKETRR